ncbi:neuronal PAS domain-containing protein 4-like [Megalops cyprinoides]|uniref:neuronal PAS domain-containing protein 4-like n=1 Tax=Megalops cyprinoides TaxID=118141 RepID=UPI001863D26B|nr:neuronal PAS domain-containing protein 4-like [Megalops cyprinoides]
MTVCCESSPMNGKRGSSPCSSPSITDARVNARKVSACKRFRSTKGASKARRDHINAEIRNMRALLPIAVEEQERLSYLHSMSAICTYIRKSVFYQELQSKKGGNSYLPYEDFLQALPGFIVAMTSEGKLIYVSENVAEYLGFSMIDLLQGDSFYDMVEKRDVDFVKSQLEVDAISETEKAFVCRMHTSKSFRLRHSGSCSILVRGHFQSVPQSSPACADLGHAFFALCTPTVNRTADSDSHCFTEHFKSSHQLDMTFTHVSESVPFHLGYSMEAMIGQSWYKLLHPEDLTLGAEAHKILLQVDEEALVEIVLRLQCRDLSWAWLYIRAAKDSGKQTVTCNNYVISETEAKFLIQKIYADMQEPFRSFLQHSSNPLLSHIPPYQSDNSVPNLKRPRLPSNQSDQPQNKASRLSGPEVSSVVSNDRVSESVSPAELRDCPAFLTTRPQNSVPSHSPSLQDETDSDFLLDIYRYAEDLLSPPGGLPSYLSFQDPHCEPSGSLSSTEPLPAIIDQDFNLNTVRVTSPPPSPEPCPSPLCEFPCRPTHARLVPDYLPAPGACEGPSDGSFHLEGSGQPPSGHAGGGSYLSPGGAQSISPLPSALLSPAISPAPGTGFPYSEVEQAEISTLARQISSLASSFNSYRVAGRSQSPAPAQDKAFPDVSTGPPAREIPAQVYSWPHAAVHPLKPELVLDEGVIDSILKDLDRVPGAYAPPSSSRCALGSGHQAPDLAAMHSDALTFVTLLDGVSLEQFPSFANAMDTCILRTGHQEDTELHQLNHFFHRSLQQGNFPVRCIVMHE